eukprot:2882053-Rhodomonas_salina.2
MPQPITITLTLTHMLLSVRTRLALVLESHPEVHCAPRNVSQTPSKISMRPARHDRPGAGLQVASPCCPPGSSTGCVSTEHSIASA